jgi:TetR/AcrR family transcriptional regulator, tetracycline repressor protein
VAAKPSAKDNLSRDAVVDRALQLADTEGLEAVTIRGLAQQFGVTPMALYWHVANKDELLDAMGDRIFQALRVDYSSDAAWDVQLRAVVQALVDALRAHPTCVELAYRRVFACPEGQQVAEHTLGLLRGAGFAVRQSSDIARHALQTAVMLVTGEPGAEPGCSEDDRLATLAAKRAALIALPTELFPHIREAADDLLHCDDVRVYYDFGIDMFVAGARASLGERAESTA